MVSNYDSQSTAGQAPRYATFNSTKVLICGYPENVVTALTKYIEQEGGKVLKKYYKGSRPDVIVCGTVADRSCKEARRAWQDAVPVVTQEWVQECAKQKAQVDVGPFKLGALVGLEICATNYVVRAERALLQQLVEQGGGVWSAELHKGRTTHLMCKTGTGKKYGAAVQWRCVHVVTDGWLRETMNQGYPANEASHKVEPSPEPRPSETTDTAAAAAAGAPASKAPVPHAVSDSVMFGSVKQPSTSTAANKAQQQQQQQQVAEAETEPEAGEASSKPRGKRPVAAVAGAERQPGSKTRRGSQRQPASAAEAAGQADDADPEQIPDPAEQPAAGAAAATAAAAGAAAAAAVPQNATARRLAGLGITDAEAAPMFLERVVLWWCGIPEGSNEHMELQAILHAYAGVRFPELHDTTTHILIDVHAGVEDLNAVRQYVSTCNRRIELVSPAWLQLCHREQRLVPADSRCRLQINSLVRSTVAVQGGSSGQRTAGSTGGGVFANTASRGGFPADADKQEAVWVPEYWHEKPADPLKLFEGCYFTLAALQSHPSDHEKALGIIRRKGGNVFNADSIKPPVRWPKVFALCPHSLPSDAEASLMLGDASFRVVHPSCRVTLHWLELCVKHSELVRVTPRNPLLAPLRFSLPLRDFAHISVAVTGYKEGQRATIERLVLLLGGTFCKTLGRQQRVTHLMLPRWGPDTAADAAAAAAGAADGGPLSPQQPLAESTVKKIAYAMRHKLEMVVSEWLLDCAAEGRRVQEGLHRPLGDVSLLELPAAGATQAPGATQLPVTQLAPTQTPALPPVNKQASAAAGPGTRSLASLLSGPAPVPRPSPAASKPAAVAAGTAAASNAAAPATGPGSSDPPAAAAAAAAPKSNWFTANRVGSNTRSSQPQQAAAVDAAPPQQQQPQALPQAQQQQQQGKQPGRSKVLSSHKASLEVTPTRSSSRKRSAAAAAAAAEQPDGSGATAAAAGATKQPGSASTARKRQCKQQQGQASNADEPAAAAAAAAACDADHSVAGPLPAGAAAADVDAETQGHDDALTGVLSVLSALDSKNALDIANASQVIAGELMHLSDTMMPASRMAPSLGAGSGAAGGGSGGGASGGGASGGRGLKGRRKAGGLSRASSGGAGSGVESLDAGGSDQGGSGMSAGGAAAGQGASKRLQRSSSGAKSAAGAAAAGAAAAGADGAGGMRMPPTRKGAAAAAAAGGGAQSGAAAGASRYGTRRSSSATTPADLAFEPSQQVGYDVGVAPEALLAARAGSKGQRQAAEDARKEANMLARLNNLRSRSGS